MALSKGSSLSAGAAGGGAMELISTTTISGSPSTIEIKDGFSSTYDNYVVLATGINVSNNNDNVYMRVYKEDSLLTTSYIFNTANGTTTNTTYFTKICYVITDMGFEVELVNANSTHFTMRALGYARATNAGRNNTGTGGITGIQFSAETGTVTFSGGTIKLYGIKK